MAKRKADPRRRRKTAPKRAHTRAARGAGRRAAARKRPGRKRPAHKTAGRKAVAKKAATPSRKSASKQKAVAKKRARQSARAIVKSKVLKKVAAKRTKSIAKRKVIAKGNRKIVATRLATAPNIADRTPKAKAQPRVLPPALTRAKAAAAQKRKLIPGLNRERRTIRDDDDVALTPVPSPPSSLDLDRTASSARSGRRGLREKFDEHTETSPAITGGDVDADWESAYSVGDEAPGGDNPTPDQDIVDEIGRAVGVEYQDNEELKGEKKITDRDKHRWELDPASAEDYDDR